MRHPLYISNFEDLCYEQKVEVFVQHYSVRFYFDAAPVFFTKSVGQEVPDAAMGHDQ